MIKCDILAKASCCSSRLLQISSFNGKMNALNEVNKLIANVTYNLHKHGQGELDEWLTTDKVAVSIAACFVYFRLSANLTVPEIGVYKLVVCKISILGFSSSLGVFLIKYCWLCCTR